MADQRTEKETKPRPLATTLDPNLLSQWRAAAHRLGGLPAEHPNVPAEYVYTANRLAAVVDSLVPVAVVVPEEASRG